MMVFLISFLSTTVFILTTICGLYFYENNNLDNKKYSEPKLSEIYYGEYPMKVLTKEKYIKVNYDTVVSMVNSGIELIYHDYYEIYYFYEDSYDIWNRKKIFCLTTIKDTKKIKNFLENKKITDIQGKKIMFL